MVYGEEKKKVGPAVDPAGTPWVKAGLNGDCAMLNYNMMTDCIMFILLCRDPLNNPCFHSFKLMGPLGPWKRSKSRFSTPDEPPWKM